MTNSSLDCWTVARRQSFNAQYLLGVVSLRNDRDGDRRDCRNARLVHDSGAWHLNLEAVVFTESIRVYPSAGSQTSSDRRHGTSGRSCSSWTCWLAFSVAHSCPRRSRPSCQVRHGHAKTAPRPLNRLARCCRRFPRRLPRSQWTRSCPGPGSMALFLVRLPKKPHKDDSKNRYSSTSREFSS